MTLRALLLQQNFLDVISEGARVLKVRPEDMAAVSCVAGALVGLGRYQEALPYLQVLDKDARVSGLARGRPGRQLDIACIHWMLNDRATAMGLMTGLVDGILDGTINYGDLAGGVSQGLLLYYMGVTTQDEGAKTKALGYLGNRAKRSAAKSFPGPVASYYLDQIDFSELLAAATAKRGAVRDVAAATEIARNDLLTRRFVCVALFHDGAKARARGDEAHCMQRMLECLALKNPLIEQEWYLARYEVEQAGGD